MSVVEKIHIPKESPVAPHRLRRIKAALADELGLGAIYPPLLIVNSVIALFPYLIAKRLRSALYRLAGLQIGPRTVMYGKVDFWGPPDMCRNLTIGSDCRINRDCHIDLNGPVTIGNRVVFGFGVTVVTASHNMDDPLCRAGAHDIQPVTIEDGAWIAANTLIRPGVTIGAGAVVGAGSIVTRDVPAHTLAAGNPARIVREFPESLAEEVRRDTLVS